MAKIKGHPRVGFRRPKASDHYPVTVTLTAAGTERTITVKSMQTRQETIPTGKYNIRWSEWVVSGSVDDTPIRAPETWTFVRSTSGEGGAISRLVEQRP